MHATLTGEGKKSIWCTGVRNNLGVQLKNATTGSTYHKETLCTRTTHMLQQSCNNLILLLWKCGEDEDGFVQQRSFRGTVMYTAGNAACCVGRRCMHSYHACQGLTPWGGHTEKLCESQHKHLSERRTRSLQGWLH